MEPDRYWLLLLAGAAALLAIIVWTEPCCEAGRRAVRRRSARIAWLF
jgi:hypothetical protein